MQAATPAERIHSGGRGAGAELTTTTGG